MILFSFKGKWGWQCGLTHSLFVLQLLTWQVNSGMDIQSYKVHGAKSPCVESINHIQHPPGPPPAFRQHSILRSELCCKVLSKHLQVKCKPDGGVHLPFGVDLVVVPEQHYRIQQSALDHAWIRWRSFREARLDMSPERSGPFTGGAVVDVANEAQYGDERLQVQSYARVFVDPRQVLLRQHKWVELVEVLVV